MKKILSLFLTIALAVGLTACSDNWKPGGDAVDSQGQVSLKSMGVDVNTDVTVSRAGVDLSNFIVTINNAGGSKVAQWTYAEMPELFALPVGAYTVTVINAEVQKAAFNAPYYVGTKEFTIVDGEITEVGVVVCQLANVKVSILFADNLRERLGDDVTVTVEANDDGTLVYTPETTDAGYFEYLDNSMTLVATFHGTIIGEDQPVTLRKTYTNVEAGNYYKITFTLRGANEDIPDETGSVELSDGLVLDTDVEGVDVNTDIDINEDNIDDSDRPGQEGEDPNQGQDPNPGDDPDPSTDEVITFTTDSPGLDLNGVNSADLSEYVVKIHAYNGVAHLVVNISSNSDSFMASLESVHMPTTFDLAYPTDDEQAEVFASFDFPYGDQVIGKTDVLFDVSGLVPLLKLYSGTHSFTLTVTDQDNIQRALVLKILVP